MSTTTLTTPVGSSSCSSSKIRSSKRTSMTTGSRAQASIMQSQEERANHHEPTPYLIVCGECRQPRAVDVASSQRPDSSSSRRGRRRSSSAATLLQSPSSVSIASLPEQSQLQTVSEVRGTCPGCELHSWFRRTMPRTYVTGQLHNAVADTLNWFEYRAHNVMRLEEGLNKLHEPQQDEPHRSVAHDSPWPAFVEQLIDEGMPGNYLWRPEARALAQQTMREIPQRLAQMRHNLLVAYNVEDPTITGFFAKSESNQKTKGSKRNSNRSASPVSSTTSALSRLGFRSRNSLSSASSSQSSPVSSPQKHSRAREGSVSSLSPTRLGQHKQQIRAPSPQPLPTAKTNKVRAFGRWPEEAARWFQWVSGQNQRELPPKAMSRLLGDDELDDTKSAYSRSSFRASSASKLAGSNGSFFSNTSFDANEFELMIKAILSDDDDFETEATGTSSIDTAPADAAAEVEASHSGVEKGAAKLSKERPETPADQVH